MPHDIPRREAKLQPEIEAQPKPRRPLSVITKARREYDRVYIQQLEKYPGKYRNAVRRALQSYDRVLKNYDRKFGNSSHT